MMGGPHLVELHPVLLAVVQLLVQALLAHGRVAGAVKDAVAVGGSPAPGPPLARCARGHWSQAWAQAAAHCWLRAWWAGAAQISQPGLRL